MKDKIVKALEREFANHRVVFWYDEKQEFAELCKELELEQVEMIEIANNEFQIKYRILKQEANQKFLLYLPYPQPEDRDNWLLDLQLAEGVFKSDKVGLQLSEFGNNNHAQQALTKRPFFLNSEKRRKDLLKLIEPEDRVAEIELKMLAVCTNSSPEVESILNELIKEYVQKKESKLNLLIKSNLEPSLWSLLASRFNYKTDKPSIKDFLAELFDSSWKHFLEEETTLHGSAVAFLNNYKDNRKNRELFSQLSQEFAKFYNIPHKLLKIEIMRVRKIDVYREVDTAVIGYLIKSILQETISQKDCAEIIKDRESSFWYSEYKDVYKSIAYGVEFLEKLSKTDLTLSSMEDGLQKYSTTWYELDQLYRRFIFKLKKAHHHSALQSLHKEVENSYTNNFLLNLNNAWQKRYDWHQKTRFIDQHEFFNLVVNEELKQRKVAVIISDALRYEVGQELLTRIISENRYAGELEFMVGNIPSNTQLGMASLLPHTTLELDSKKLGYILLDGKNTVGLEDRKSILQSAVPESQAFNYNDFMKIGNEEVKTILVENKLLYIYHNTIDAVGDKLASEGELTSAVERAIEQLIGLTKKIAGTSRITNFIITADHGFLYQDSQVEESDFVELNSLTGKFSKSRRFIIGEKLPQASGLMKFTSEELNLGKGLEILIPKSINRLRVQGAGSKYVHGGASLQELVIPLLRINKSSRVDDVEGVEVELFSQKSNVITTGGLPVTLYQKEAVTEKIKPKVISIGFYSKEGELLSDLHEITFDSTSEQTGDREYKVDLLLNQKAEEFNDQDIVLKLKEKKSGTNKFVDYKSKTYFLKRTFFSDF